MKYRIKQIAKDKFIPQVKTWFLGYWVSIDLNGFRIWYADKIGERYCTCSTLEEAKKVIDNYKLYLKNQTEITAAKQMFYPKYHKL